MAKRTEAYVDTSALIAFLDGSDTYHLLFAELFAAPPSLVTSSLVVAEGHGWFLKRYDNYRATQFLNFVDELKAMAIRPIGKEELVRAARIIRKFTDQELTLADAVGLWIMEERKIRVCWSTDRHLGLTGIPLVIHQIGSTG